jgi:hypothetical protein
MYFRGLAVMFVPLLVFSLSSIAQIRPLTPNPGGVHSQLCTLSGRVTEADGQPVPGAKVEVRDARSGSVVDTTSTQADGSFEMDNLNAGNYDVLAQSGAVSVHNYVPVQRGLSSTELRLPTNTGQNQATLSVAAMMVPAKARDAYNEARQSFAAGKPDRVQKDLDHALQLYPHFAEALTLRAILEAEERNFSSSTAI